MNRRAFLAGAPAVLRSSNRRARPNVLVIMTDQQTASAMGAAGCPYVRTPHMDRLARQGARFVNSWCTSPVCSPARASLITGLWPTGAGVVFNGDVLRPGVATVGEIFRAAGYDSAWAGKWHLPAAFPGARATAQPRVERGFEVLPFAVPGGRISFGDFTDDPIAGAAAAYIRRRREKPFLLFASLHNPHDICYWVMNKLPEGHPSRAESGVPEGDLPPLPANFGRLAAEPEFIERCRRRAYYGEENTYTPEWDQTRWRRYLYAYYRMVERVDRGVGTLLAALREAGREDDTLVAFTSDHGEGSAAHHWVVKLMLWQETLSVPLLFRWKGTIPEGRVDAGSLVSGADLTPTLCEFAGLPPPAAAQGASLRAALVSATPLPRTSLYAQLDPDPKDPAFQGRAVRTREFKYIAFSHGQRRELLFDLSSDAGETRDLARSADHAPVFDRHRRMLREWEALTARGLLRPTAAGPVPRV